ncbi:MAG: hypothetical protein HY799_00900 [Nitrosomonadales bacterium]|nr:hypothetical protein [Nitrosomonadales bacterium]
MINREVVLHTLKCSPEHYPKMLDEQFPHILEKIVKLWDTPDAEPYIAKLLRPNAERFDREGFPDEVWGEILHLQVLNGRQHPH